MAAEDEAKARAVLAEMQLRISHGPFMALGIDEGVSAEQVRSAFLALTKQFHPARFGRMPPDLQKLSNEVFLGIKQAHDSLVKTLGSSGRVPFRTQGGDLPIVPAEGTSRTQVVRPSDRNSLPSGTTPPPTVAGGREGGQRYSTPPNGVPVLSRTATGQLPIQRQTGPVSRPAGPAPAAQRPTQQLPPLVVRPQTPTTGRTPTPTPSSAARTPTPPAPTRSSSPVISRTTTPPAIGRPMSSPNDSGSLRTPSSHAQSPRGGADASSSATNFQVATVRGVTGTGASPPLTAPATGPRPPSQPPPATNFNMPTVRGLTPAQPTQPLQRVAPHDFFDEQSALREALSLLDLGNWAAARQAMHALAAKVPQSRHYRALLCYARGREAHGAGRSSEALTEYQRALQLDPALAQAKQAVAELQRRR